MSENERIAQELLNEFKKHYKHSPSVMKTIEKVIKKVLGVN